ncbi:lytic transglycosylase domain-containing protein [Ruminococcus sp. SR1/5]|uniref:lytic transglycosylase domain-containing protein n=1 Tax=Ruminococcus sp. SR1/5 TaxID=657323 RepID=UPI0026811812|nr:lytic transglycosylase domain-containing protein [Ruminococcus sp. SR1/5]
MGKVESDFNPNVVSGAGASGIMQLMPSTAASLGVSNVFDPRENIMGGAKYVSQLIEQFKGYSNGLELAIAGYNAGPGAVMKYGYQIPPYAETQAYVKKVLGYVEIQQHQTSTSSSSAKNVQKSDADTEKLQTSYELLKESVEKHLDSFLTGQLQMSEKAKQRRPFIVWK